MFGPGCVIVPAQPLARFHTFTICLNDLELPEGSQTVFGLGSSITENLNTALRALRPQDEWVWFIGDDHVFEKDTVLHLLARDLDVVAPLCTQRQAPFGLVHADSQIAGTEFYAMRQFEELPEDGEPFEVEATGSAMLVKREVLDAIGDPWFGTTNGRQNEDLDFCRKAKDAGFKVWVDPKLAIGHTGHIVSYPQYRDGVWGLVIDLLGHGNQKIFLPGGVKPGSMGELEAKVPVPA